MMFSSNVAWADEPVVTLNSANQALADGKIEEALAQYDAAEQLMPGRPLLAYNKGVALGKLGRHEEALAALDKALELKPNDEKALQLKKLLAEKDLTKPKKPFRLFKKLFAKS